jgi:hypothetical protein
MSNVFVVNNGPSFSVANTLPTGLGSLTARLQFQNQYNWQNPNQQLNETVSSVKVALAQPASKSGATSQVNGAGNLADNGCNGTNPANGTVNPPVNSVQLVQNAPLAVKANL